MRVAIAAKSALISIKRNKTRSLLTTLGVVIGVAAVILLTSLGNGLKRLISDQFDALGTNQIMITAGDIIKEGGGFDMASAGLTVSKFTIEDVEAIKRIGDPIVSAAPVTESTGEVRYKTEKVNTFFMISTPDYTKIRDLKMTSGRFFTDADEVADKRVVVIGPNLEEDLFGKTSGLNKEIAINGINFEVIGIAEPKDVGGFGGPDFDSVVYIPYDIGKKTLEIRNIMYIAIKVDSADDMNRAKILAEKTLSRRLDEEDYSIVDQSELLDSINTILNALTSALAGIAAISLLVGGIGIMNIMLVAVTERTKEIGLRKALGATPNDILVQFLIEASVLSGLGGIIGIAIGVLGALAIDSFIPAKPTLGSIALAFSVSVIVGIVFGVFPARKASKLSPIEALRYE
ncbi:MAG: ABC transporter permease [bacterium]